VSNMTGEQNKKEASFNRLFPDLVPEISLLVVLHPAITTVRTHVRVRIGQCPADMLKRVVVLREDDDVVPCLLTESPDVSAELSNLRVCVGLVQVIYELPKGLSLCLEHVRFLPTSRLVCVEGFCPDHFFNRCFSHTCVGTEVGHCFGHVFDLLVEFLHPSLQALLDGVQATRESLPVRCHHEPQRQLLLAR